MTITIQDKQIVDDIMMAVETLGLTKRDVARKLLAKPAADLAKKARDIKAIMDGAEYVINHPDGD